MNGIKYKKRYPTALFYGFSWVPLGGGRGIRTPVPVKANGFQDHLVMTTSICLRIF